MLEVLSLVVGFVGGSGGTLYGLAYLRAKRTNQPVFTILKELLIG